MGEPLYEQVVGPTSEGKLGRPCRIYAPVGTHDTLLAYLVRRLLENGANTSFVNRIASDAVPLEELVAEPGAHGRGARRAGRRARPAASGDRPAARRCSAPSGSTRSASISPARRELRALDAAFAEHAAAPWSAGPLLGVDAVGDDAHPVLNPADRRDVVGQCRDATADDVRGRAGRGRRSRGRLGSDAAGEARAALLEGGADRLEADTPERW